MSLPVLEHHIPLVGDDGKILPGWRKLARADAWVCWRFGPPRPNGKRAKLPISAKTGSGKNWSAPENLTDYMTALRCAHANSWAGVGLAVRRELGIVGLDLDGARRRGEDGRWLRRRWAGDILGGELETYVEVSPSGEGYRAIALGELDRDVAANDSGIECYGGEGGRYLTITGNRVAGSPLGPKPAVETIRRALDRARSHGGKAEPSALKVERPASGGLLPALAEGKAPQAMDIINAVALQRVDLWLPELHPDAERSSNGAWRVSSESLGRDRDEDISIHAEKGIVDFGEHDMGDAREGKRTAVDLTLKQYGGICDSPLEGAQWLLRRLGLFASMQAVMLEKGAAFKGVEPADVFTERVERIAVEWPHNTLPAPIARQAENMAERLGVGVDVASATVLAAMAACVPSNVRLDMRGDGTWHVSAALYFALSGAPGAAKSPTIKAALAPVVAHDRKAARQHDAALKRHQRQGKSGTGAAGEPPADRRRRVGNTTLEAAIRRHAVNAAGLIVDPDELTSWLGSIDKYSQGSRGGGESGFWLSGFDGADYSMDRASGLSVYIPRLHVSILGGLTPKVLARLTDNLAEDGLIQRFIFAHMQETRLGNPVDPDPDTERTYEESCAYILAMESCGDIVVRPSRAAARVLREGEEWSHALQSNPTTPDVLANTAGKARGIIGRIALALHVIEHAAGQRGTHPFAADIAAAGDDDDPMLALPASKAAPPEELTAATASRALEVYRRFFWPSLGNVFERLDAGSQVAEDARAIALHLLRRQPDGFEFTARAIYKSLKRFDGNGRARLGVALTDLAEAGWLSPEETKGRFGTKYRVNPAIYDGRFAHIGH